MKFMKLGTYNRAAEVVTVSDGKKLAKFLIVVLLIFLFAARAQAADEARVKDEMGLRRITAVYPAPGENIDETTPMIAADASQLETPLDPKTVSVALNGVDVTDDAEITASYVVYQPPSPLGPGRYDVRITAKDVNRNDIEPLTWTFTVGGGVAVPGAVGAVGVSKKDNTTGRLSVSTDYIAADYVPQPAFDISELFREKEGMKLNADLSFTNVSGGRTLIGSYHRETQYYSDIETDKWRLNYYDDNFESTLGNFWLATSDLTLLGAELAGVELDKKAGPWSSMFFSGRTQDPSTSGTFKQITTGARGAFAWNKYNTSSLTALYADERDNTAYEPTDMPARDEIASFRHEYIDGEDFSASLELARNIRTEKGAASTHSGAEKLDVSARYGKLSGEGSLYRIPDDYLPIAEGSSRYLKSNRRGFLMKGGYAATEMLTLGGEFEEYDEFDVVEPTIKRAAAFAAFSFDGGSTLAYRKSKLVRSGTSSESDSVNGTLVLPATDLFAETRISLGWQNISYDAAAVTSNTDIYMASVATSYKDKLRISVSHTFSNNGAESAASGLTESDNKTSAVALNWNIIPFKLMWIGQYEVSDNSGTSSDDGETRFKNMVKYVIDKTYTLNLGLDFVAYTDSISHTTDYDQTILRTGVEWNF
jgi:hypothetical protein